MLAIALPVPLYTRSYIDRPSYLLSRLGWPTDNKLTQFKTIAPVDTDDTVQYYCWKSVGAGFQFLRNLLTPPLQSGLLYTVCITTFRRHVVVRGLLAPYTKTVGINGWYNAGSQREHDTWPWDESSSVLYVLDVYPTSHSTIGIIDTVWKKWNKYLE